MEQGVRAARKEALAAAFVIAVIAVGAGVSSGAAGRATASLNAPASNGASDHVTFSQDGRTVRWVAYDSTASNLVAGDTNQRRDVFVLTRSNPGTSANFNGSTSLGSVGYCGAVG